MPHATSHATHASSVSGMKWGGRGSASASVASHGEMHFDLLFECDDEDDRKGSGIASDLGGIPKRSSTDTVWMTVRDLRTLCAPRGVEASEALEALRETSRFIGDSRAFKDDSRAEHVRQCGLQKLESELRARYPAMFAHVQRSKTSCATRGAESLKQLTHTYLWLPPSGMPNSHQMHYRSMMNDDERVIIEPNLRSHFVVGRATDAYKKLVEEVPECFVGSHAQLGEIVSLMCEHMTASFHEVGLDIPPWRQPAALTSKWAVSASSTTASPSSSPVTPLAPFSFTNNSYAEKFMERAYA